MPKSKYSKAPKKGSRTRQFLMLAMREQGVGVGELINLWRVNDPDKAMKHISGMVPYLHDMGGWDIRIFRSRITTVTETVSSRNVYKVVGRFTWKGGYRSFLKEDIWKEK